MTLWFSRPALAGLVCGLFAAGCGVGQATVPGPDAGHRSRFERLVAGSDAVSAEVDQRIALSEAHLADLDVDRPLAGGTLINEVGGIRQEIGPGGMSQSIGSGPAASSPSGPEPSGIQQSSSIQQSNTVTSAGPAQPAAILPVLPDPDRDLAGFLAGLTGKQLDLPAALVAPAPGSVQVVTDRHGHQLQLRALPGGTDGARRFVLETLDKDQAASWIYATVSPGGACQRTARADMQANGQEHVVVLRENVCTGKAESLLNAEVTGSEGMHQVIGTRQDADGSISQFSRSLSESHLSL